MPDTKLITIPAGSTITLTKDLQVDSSSFKDNTPKLLDVKEIEKYKKELSVILAKVKKFKVSIKPDFAPITITLPFRPDSAGNIYEDNGRMQISVNKNASKDVKKILARFKGPIMDDIMDHNYDDITNEYRKNKEYLKLKEEYATLYRKINAVKLQYTNVDYYNMFNDVYRQVYSELY